ncbi:GerMN domain-containing protein [Actinoplanes aureus]|uniref:GerMN domain-containing protein n=1 Tax=Actinoplanes aureus TaxID=2792083 RepID=A0A931C8M8_9ACTN|nr:GerMN domain-containing protein [Actinoplanes aureus]MBG0565445.1 GerMN domain-containing protein [Actinoplanes aureus]
MIAVRARAALATALLLLAGCGVPAQDEPHPVTLPRPPLGTASPVASAAAGGEAAQVLCLVRDNRLTQTVRRVDSVTDPQRQLDQLVAGPTAAEQAQGLTTALAATALTVTLPPGATTATVEVGAAGEGAARSDEVLAYGQIVCTLTARTDIATVAFVRAGRPLQVPRGDGTLSSSPLRVADYRSLIGPG